MEPPTINIPPLVRFLLYLLASLALLTVSYAVDKNWAGDAEVQYVTGLSGLLFILAAAKTGVGNAVTTVRGMVTSPQTGETGAISATLSTDTSPDDLPEATGVDLGAEEGDDGLSYEEAGGRPYASENYNEGEDYGIAPDPRNYPRTIEDGSPDR